VEIIKAGSQTVTSGIIKPAPAAAPSFDDMLSGFIDFSRQWIGRPEPTNNV